MASVCQSTHEDKKVVLSACYKQEVELLAKNLMHTAKLVRNSNPFDWKYDYNAN